ncbi:unnamed protein product [Cuscuta campestris]|uniref:Uncharacterized protein n=1 Tax=Cuscuta campestris TaxID=132261 RepID=A0A484KQ48_9ASTE|nr:unnamed protein product [Cuscuta campestris]
MHLAEFLPSPTPPIAVPSLTNPSLRRASSQHQPFVANSSPWPSPSSSLRQPFVVFLPLPTHPFAVFELEVAGVESNRHQKFCQKISKTSI